MNVLAGAAGALAVRRLAMVVELQRDADDVIALLFQQRGDDARIDAAGHGDDDARFRPGDAGEHGSAHTVIMGLQDVISRGKFV